MPRERAFKRILPLAIENWLKDMVEKVVSNQG
jgi:hypothetical protein